MRVLLNNGSQRSGPGTINNFDPWEKLKEAFDQVNKLQEENKALYERMLKEKDEMIALLTKGK